MLPSVLTPEAMAATNKKLQEDLASHPLEAGELFPMITITAGNEQPVVSTITMREIPDPNNPDSKIVVFSRVLKTEGLLELIKSLMAN